MTFLNDLVTEWSASLSIEHEDYLLGRGASEKQIDALDLGTVKGSFSGKTKDEMRFDRWSQGLERWQNFLSFPLHDQVDNVAGVLVRDPVEKKYTKFTLESQKGSAYFFGLKAAIEAVWATRIVWVVEGPFDWFPIQRIFPATVATTTDAVTWAQATFLRRYARIVVLALDMDDAGREGIEISKKRIGPTVSYRVVRFPYKDAGEFWEREGSRTFTDHFREQARALGVL